jgi:hypothetical protein
MAEEYIEDYFEEEEIIKLIKFHSLGEEALKICKDYAGFYINRYLKELRKLRHEEPEKFQTLVRKGRVKEVKGKVVLPKKRKCNIYVGLLGEKAFHLLLQELNVPCDYNEPVVDWRGFKVVDFRIPFLGLVEIKTANFNASDVSINCREFKKANPTIVVACQVSELSSVLFYGYMTKEEIESYKPIGYGYRRYWSIPLIDFVNKHPCQEDLIACLNSVREKIRKLEQKEGLIDVENPLQEWGKYRDLTMKRFLGKKRVKLSQNEAL